MKKKSDNLIIASKELEQANERFELIGKATSDGLWDWNLETSLVWGNEVHQKMHGLSLADPTPNYEEWKYRVHPEDRERTVKTLEETMASKCNICITEYRFFTENTGWINIYGRTLIERNNEGKPVRLIGSMVDITELKRAEQAIKQSEEKYRTLVEQASDAIFITDTTGRFITVNTSACKLSQYSEKELLKKTIYDLALTEDIQKNPFRFDELKQGKTVTNERVINRNNGIPLNVEVTSKLLADGRLLAFVRDISERIKTQAEIVREKNLSNSIINSLPGIFYLFTMDGKFLRWNKNFETVTKYSAEEIEKMHPLDFFDEDEKELVSRKIKNVFISSKETVQANFLPKTKEKIPYYFTGIAISYEGSPCMLGVGIDFSELKTSQQALAKNENHLQAILQTNPECIKLVGINGELEEMNPAGLAMIEADSFEQIKGKLLFNVIDKPYRKAFSQLTQNVFKGKSGKLEFEIMGLKGTHRWMETHAVPLKDAEGKIVSLLGITRDITERKKTEKEIMRVIKQYDMIAKATSDTIWDWDITNDKILYNEGITNMFGYEKTKIENIAEWWKTKIHPDDMQIVQEAVAAAFERKSYNLQLEYRFRCADESFKYIYDRAFIIYDEHKKPCRMIGAMQDISKLKENEISLIELNENLQKQTKELSISNEELEGRNQVLQDIAWTQSHIVRAPLARMMGIVSIIKDLRVESPDYEEWINHFTTSANELDNIIKDIVNKTDITKLDKS
ncbi:MAG: PAS domain S-box protein [Daejeonella sp.]|uniref:PAS domain-containing protein n=1 Tax=Daejeonella sp. TaxID=2805397 RepID=UPI003C741B5D